MIGFGAPLMLFGAALVGVPLLIHLLNRRRFDIRPFAALQFLQQAFARRRRRLRMENLLLLILRCLVVLFAVLAMSLPFVASDNPLAVFGTGRRDVVLLMDRSASTGRRLDAGSDVADRLLELVRREVSKLSDERGDAITLLTPGTSDLLPAPIGASPSQVLEVIDAGLPALGGVADLVDALRVVLERVRPAVTGRLEVVILSDMQELSWVDAVGPVLARLAEQGELRVSVVDATSDAREPTNLGVESLRADDALLLAGEPLVFTAVVRNHGDVLRRGVTGTFELDGTVVRRRADIEVPPRGSAEVELRLRIDDPGSHHLVFRLEDDDLPYDDARTLAFDVRGSIEVLLVDGAHGTDRLERATGFLELALLPRLESATGDDILLDRFQPDVVDVRTFEESDRELYRYDAIVLADVGGLTEAAVANLTAVVSSGTPLLVFTGERARPAFYSDELAPLLPAAVGEMQGDPSGERDADYSTLVLADPPPAGLSLLADPRLAMLLQVPVLAWSRLVPDEDAEVLAWFADSLGRTTPAIVQGRLGLGRIVLVGTSADDTWSLLPRHPSTWLPLVHEFVGLLTAHDPSVRNVPLGAAPALVLQGMPRRARLEHEGVMSDLGVPEVETLGPRSRLSLAARPLTEPGPWMLSVEFDDPARAPLAIALAALPDPREGDLRRVDAATLERRLAGVEYALVSGESLGDDGEAASEGGSDGQLFRMLLWLLLAAALGESVVARLLGGRR